MSTTQQKDPSRASNARIVVHDDTPNADTAKSIPQMEREAGIAGTKKAQAATAYA